MAIGGLLMLISSSLEGLSAAAVLPLLLGLMGRRPAGTGPGTVVVLFCGLVVLGGLLRWLSLWTNGRLAAALGSDLAERALTGVFALPFQQQRDLPASQVVSVLAPQLRQLIQFILLPVLQLISAVVLLLALLLVMVLLAWQVVWPTLLLMALVYGLLTWQVRPRLAVNGRRVMQAQQEAIRLVQQSMGGLRELRLRVMARRRVSRFMALDRPMRSLEADNTALGGLPRFLIEPAAMVAIVLAGTGLLRGGVAPEQVLPRLGLLAYGAQRLLPVGQQLWSSWSSVVAGTPLLEPLLPLLEQALLSDVEQQPPPLNWRRSVRLEDIRFRYGADRAPVVDGLTLEVACGEWIGLEGPSGCGKSTVLDLLMALLSPEAGQLRVDGAPLNRDSQRLRAWQQGIAYCGARPPVLATLVSSAVTVDQEEHQEQLEQVLRLTGLLDLAGRPLGEQGQNLSAGQLQRLGLARALLGNPTLLVLDEATNALDAGAEADLLRRLRESRPRLTVVMVSHRRETFLSCDRVVQLR